MKLALSNIFLLFVSIIYGRTNPDANEIIYLHNKIRGSVSPTASNMIALDRSDCLASVESDYLVSCPGFKHNPNRTRDAQEKGCLTNISPAYVGENMYLGSSNLTNYTQAINSWACHWKNGPRKFWSGGPIFSGKIGPPLKVLVLHGPIFHRILVRGDHFFQGKLVRGTIFFREFWSGGPIFHKEFWSAITLL